MEPKTAFELLQQYNNERPDLSFGCGVLDKAIGRIPTCGINEISGEAGAGKTQFCLGLSLQCQLPISSGGLGGACAYIISGEGEFPIRRLSQLQTSPRYEGCTLEKVLIEQCYSPEDMTTTLRTKIPEMCEKNSIKLLIIDSLAGLVRNEYEANSSDIRERTTFLFRFASALKWLADVHKVCVLVVNQVTSTGFESTSSTSTSHSTFADLKPALGLVWSTCVNTRIMLYRDSSNARSCEYSTTTNRVNEGENQVNVNSIQFLNDENETCTVDNSHKIKYLTCSRRFISLQFSPIHKRKTCQYEITMGGIKGIFNDVDVNHNYAKSVASIGYTSMSPTDLPGVHS